MLLAAVVTFMLALSGTASASLVSNLLSPITVPVGLNQLTAGIQGLLTGAQSAVAPGQALVSGFQATVDPTIAGAITSLQTRAQATAAAAAALDTTGTTAQLQGAISDLQGEATSEIGALTGVALTQALTNGLTIAQNVVSPVCSILGSPAALASGVGVDLTRFYPLITALQPIDATTSALLGNTWSTLYDAITATIPAQLGASGAIVSAVLSLLKYNWTSTYYPPNGGTPIVKTTKALLDVPTPIDVDNSGSFDLCATTSLALSGSAIVIKQQITKLPLAPAVLPVDLSGAILGVIGFGYQTKDSTAPINYTTTVSVPGSNGQLVNEDNTYTVFRGMNLTLPPLFGAPLTVPLNAPPLALGSLTLPTIAPLTTPAPTPKLTQVVSIGGSALQLLSRYENEPGVTHVDFGLTGGLKTNYTGSAPSDAFKFTTAISSLAIGSGVHPAGTAFSSCAAGLLGGAGACSNESPTDTTESASLKFTSSQPTNYDQFTVIPGVSDGIHCPTGTVSPGTDAHLFGTQFSFGQRKGSATAGSGKVYIDTGDTVTTGCVSDGTVASNGLVGTLPEGFKANKRVVTYHDTQVFGFSTGFAPDSKAGTISCTTTPAIPAVPPSPGNPLGTPAVPAVPTAFSTPSASVLSYSLVPTICPFPPANTVAPTITGQLVIDATLTAHAGTWTPGAPNAPAFAYQWFRCDGAGANCAAIPGPIGTATTYFLNYGDGTFAGGDLGHTFKVTVTGTNLDGSASADSAVTSPPVVLPPPPANAGTTATLPLVSSVSPPPGAGRQLKTTSGTWTNGVMAFHYVWIRCDEDGVSNCGASPTTVDSINYTPTVADEGHVIKSQVTAVNHGGTATVTSSNGLFVPPPPVNLTQAQIFNGASNAAGQSVLTADNLTAHTGTWKYQTSFSYVWERCDGGGANCNPVAGATSAGYVVGNADIGSTLRVIVTASNIDGSNSSTSDATGVVLLNDLAIRAPTSVPDGTVNAIAPSADGSAYLGGSFDTAGAPTGGAGAVPTTAAGVGTLPLNPDGTTAVTSAAKTQGGVVKSVSPDGSGGYYLGGTFTRVQGTPCAGLAHINNAGVLDPAYCLGGFSGEVRAVDAANGLANGLVAVGGAFTVTGGQNLVFVNASGLVLSATATPNAAVNAITDDSSVAAVGATQYYVGGDFTATDGVLAADHLAKYSTTAGTPTQVVWAAKANCAGTTVTTTCPTIGAAAPASVKAIAFIQVKVLGAGLPGIVAGGNFNSVVMNTTTTARNNAALFSTTTNALGGWNPNTDNTVRAIAVPNPVLVNNASGSIYIAGDFTKVGTTVVGHLAQYGTTALGGQNSAGTSNTSSPTNNWKPLIDNGTVNTIAFDNTPLNSSSLYIGGIYVGGSFTSSAGLVRHRLAAFKAAGLAGSLGATEGWDPDAGNTVNSLTRVGSTVVAGGAFNVLGGAVRNNLAKISPNTGLGAWNPGATGTVNALGVSGSTVYAGGLFTAAGGQPRVNLAALDATSGAATGWNPAPDGAVNALVATPTTVYIGGSFANAGSPAALRSNLAAIDGSGAATGWNPGADGPVKALALDGSTIYAGGSFANAGGAAHSNLAAINGAGTSTAWTADIGTSGDSVNAVAVAGGVVYVGGSFGTVAGVPHTNAGSVDAITGADTGFTPNPDGTVRAILPFGSTVFLAGDFLNLGGATRTHAGQVDNGAGAAKSFAPEPDGSARAIAITSGGSLVIGGSFSSIAGVLAPGAGFFGGS